MVHESDPASPSSSSGEHEGTARLTKSERTRESILASAEVLFSESQTRFVLEVPPERVVDLQENLRGVTLAQIGLVTDDGRLQCKAGGETIANAGLDEMERAWKRTLDLDGTMVPDAEDRS